MNQDITGLLWLCGLCGVPYLAGIVSVIVVHDRIRTIGLPWALVPFGGMIKRALEK